MAIHSDAKADGGCAEEKVARLEPLCNAAVVRASAARDWLYCVLWKNDAECDKIIGR